MEVVSTANREDVGWFGRVQFETGTAVVEKARTARPLRQEFSRVVVDRLGFCQGLKSKPTTVKHMWP